MKRLSFLLLLLLSLKVYSNPILVQEVKISEFYFDTDSSWVLELYYDPYFSFENNLALSICSSNSKEEFTIKTQEGENYYTIKSIDCMALDFERSGDSITLDAEWSYDQVVYGNWKGAMMVTPFNGISIVNRVKDNIESSSFSLSKTPTPGEQNKIDYVKLTGKIFNKNKESLDLSYSNLILIDDFAISIIDEAGNYSVNLPVKKYDLNYIIFKKRVTNNSSVYPPEFYYVYCDIAPLNLNVKTSDSSITANIYLKEDPSAIEKNSDANPTTLMVSPNLIRSINDASITYSVAEQTPNVSINLMNINGTLIHTQELQHYFGTITLDMSAELASGTYILSITSDNSVLKTTRLFVY